MIIQKDGKLHLTMDEIFTELKEDQETVESAKDKKLLESLEQYYLGSEIYGVLQTRHVRLELQDNTL